MGSTARADTTHETGRTRPSHNMQIACDNISPRLAESPLRVAEQQSSRTDSPPRSAPVHRFLRTISPAAWVGLDAVVIGMATVISHAALQYVMSGFGWVANQWLSAAVFCVAFATSGFVFGLYERTALLSRSAILVRSFLALGLGVVISFSCLSLVFYALASRWIALVAAIIYLVIAIPLRLWAHEVITGSPARLLCIGDGESMRKVVSTIAGLSRLHYELAGHLRVPIGPQRLIAGLHHAALRPRFVPQAVLDFEDTCPCLGTVDDIVEVLAETGADEVVVGMDIAATPTVGRAVAASLQNRCRVTDETTFLEKLMGEVPAEGISAEWVLRADVQNHWSYDACKWLLDVAVALVGLVLTLPLWPLIALAIKLDSRGPVFYRQTRVGRHGRVFTMYKFRTMGMDAECGGAQWARENDPRVTRLGRFLRNSRLDELPQLINILRGDMSLVGPRPERPEFVSNLEQLLPHYRLRHLIKPGLTGWAQIHYGYGASVADAYRKLCFDLYYLKHRSLELDTAILVRTVGTFLLGAR